MLSINDPNVKHQIDLLNIFYLHSEGQQTWIIYFDNAVQKCVSIADSLNDWEKQLPDFWRINESYLINPGIIYRFYPAEMPHFPLPLVELISGRVLAVSRQKTKTILQKWNRIQRSIIS
ncbi:LytTR family DNA-binding domain-containing protein [Larkinella sp. C7]|uniref:LytTR family DNA-binding domain-containing protein n=1 Tax=Larkinella sp. C7 TaxID=2576607 RepID=UPI00111104F2|nr:LytTR family DNA-binding domain-containing protein [Larkinella sp. C7]